MSFDILGSDKKFTAYMNPYEALLPYQVAAEPSEPLPVLLSREVEFCVSLTLGGESMMKPTLNGLISLHVYI